MRNEPMLEKTILDIPSVNLELNLFLIVFRSAALIEKNWEADLNDILAG
jgi:hypothetical protein